MAYRFVSQQEIERLHQSPDHGHPLLLAETHAAYRSMQLVADAQRVEPSFYLFFLLESRQVVFNRHVLVSCQLGKQTEFLKQMTQRTFPQLHPILHLIIADVLPIKADDTLIVVTITDDITAKG